MLLTALSKGKVTLRALSIMDAGDRTTLRFVPDDYARALDVMGNTSTPFETIEVLLVAIPGQAGGFRKICERLAADHLSIAYAYSSVDDSGKTRGGMLAVVRVNDLAKAQRVLQEATTPLPRRKQPGRRPAYAR